MAKKISDLTPATALGDNDSFVFNDVVAGNDKRVTAAGLKQALDLATNEYVNDKASLSGIDTIADLRAINVNTVKEGDTVYPSGYYTRGDGGGGKFYALKYQAKANGTATIGSGVTLPVDALPENLKSGQILEFTGDGVLTLTADASKGATSITGDLTVANIPDNEEAGLSDNGGTIIELTSGGGAFRWKRPDQGVVNVKWFGAKGDGVTNDTVAVNQAIATNKSVFFPKTSQKYLISNIQLNDDQTVYSNGATVQPISGVALKHGNRSTIYGFTLSGKGKATASGLSGIVASGVFDSKTHNVILKDFDNYAYQVDNSVDRHQGNVLSNFVIKDCDIGINNGFRGEYSKTSVGTIYGCNVGIKSISGNNLFATLTITDNQTGVWIATGQNDAHGVLSSCIINHNTLYNIRVDDINFSAFNFTGCEIYAGHIWLNYCNGVTFTSCELSGVNIYEEGARNCQFSSCHFVSEITVSPNYNSSFSEVYYKSDNIYTDSGLTVSNFFPEGSLCRATLETNTTISSGSTVNVLDNRKENKIAGNPNFAWANFFDHDTGNNYFDGTRVTKYRGLYVYFYGEVNVGRSTSYIPEDDINVALNVSGSGEGTGDILKGTLLRRYDNGSTLYINTYIIKGYIRMTTLNQVKLLMTNNTGGNVTAYRNQVGTEFITYVDAFGW